MDCSKKKLRKKKFCFKISVDGGSKLNFISFAYFCNSLRTFFYSRNGRLMTRELKLEIAMFSL